MRYVGLDRFSDQFVSNLSPGTRRVTETSCIRWSMSSNAISLIPGSHVGDYELFESIGSSADLWRAEDTR